MHKHYSYDKAKQLIEEHKENITSASLGMYEDWFWTANIIWENGVYTQELPTDEHLNTKWTEYLEKRKAGMRMLSKEAQQYEYLMVAGLCGSSWSTPTLQLVFKDGTDKMIPCHQQTGEEDEIEKIATIATKQAELLGVMSGPLQDIITPLSK